MGATTSTTAGSTQFTFPLKLEMDESLSKARFLKSHRCHDETGYYVVKTYVKPAGYTHIKDYKKELENLKRYPTPHVCPYQLVVENEKTIQGIRQYFHSSLSARLSTLPFMTKIEKKWITYQLLIYLEKAEKWGLFHGDLKCENVMLTSWNWIFVTDHAFAYKPLYLPNQNDGGFSYFFDTSNRTCYMAPERFYGTDSAPPPSTSTDDEAETIKLGDRKAKMDIFSMGCVIAELWLEQDKRLFEFGSLLRYKQGSDDPLAILNYIQEPSVRQLVLDMVHRDPEQRRSAGSYIRQWTGTLFPTYFETLHDAIGKILTADPNERVRRISVSLEDLHKLFTDKQPLSNSTIHFIQSSLPQAPLNPLSSSQSQVGGASGPASSIKDSSSPFVDAPSPFASTSPFPFSKSMVPSKTDLPGIKERLKSIINENARLELAVQIPGLPSSDTESLVEALHKQGHLEETGLEALIELCKSAEALLTLGKFLEDVSKQDTLFDLPRPRTTPTTTVTNRASPQFQPEQLPKGELRFVDGQNNLMSATLASETLLRTLLAEQEHDRLLREIDVDTFTSEEIYNLLTTHQIEVGPNATSELVLLAHSQSESHCRHLLTESYATLELLKTADADNEPTQPEESSANPSSTQTPNPIQQRLAAERREVEQRMMVAYEMLSTLYRDRGDFRQALAFHRAFLGRAKYWKDETSLQRGFQQFGLTYHAMGAYDDAITCYKQSLVFANSLKQRRNLIDLYRLLSEVYADKSVLQTATQYHNLCEELSLELKGTIEDTARQSGGIPRGKISVTQHKLLFTPNKSHTRPTSNTSSTPKINKTTSSFAAATASTPRSDISSSASDYILQQEPGTLGYVIILDILCAMLPYLSDTGLKLTCLDCFVRMSHFVDDEIRLQRLIPCLVSYLDSTRDPSALVRAQTIKTLAHVITLINEFPIDDAHIFQDYLIPVLKFILKDERETIVHQAFAEALPKLAKSAKRCLDHSQLHRHHHRTSTSTSSALLVGSGSSSQPGMDGQINPGLVGSGSSVNLAAESGGSGSSGSGGVGGNGSVTGSGGANAISAASGGSNYSSLSSAQIAALNSGTSSQSVGSSALDKDGKKDAVYETDLKELRQSFHDILTEWLETASLMVQKTVLEDIGTLADFFGPEGTNNHLLPLIFTWLNKGWELQCALFDNIVSVSQVAGADAIESYIETHLPLHHESEFVLDSAINCLASLCEAGIFTPQRLREYVIQTAPLLLHPNAWIRFGTCQFMVKIAQRLSEVETQCFVIPHLRRFLTHDITFVTQATLLQALHGPVSRSAYEKVMNSLNLNTTAQIVGAINESGNLSASSGGPGASGVSGASGASGSGSVTQSRSSLHGSDPASATTGASRRFNMLSSESITDFVVVEHKDGVAHGSSSGFGTKSAASSLFGSISGSGGGTAEGKAMDLAFSLGLAELDLEAQDEEKLFWMKEYVKLARRERMISNKPSSEKGRATAVSPDLWAKEYTQLSKEKTVHDIAQFLTPPPVSAVLPSLDTAGPEEPTELWKAMFGSTQQQQQANMEAALRASNPAVQNLPQAEIDEPKVIIVPASSSGEAAPGSGHYHQHHSRDPSSSSSRDALHLGSMRISKSTSGTSPASNWQPQGLLVATLSEHMEAVTQLQVAKDGAFIASGSHDGKVKIWDSQQFEHTGPLRSACTYGALGSAITSIAMCQDSHSVAAASIQGSIHVFRVDGNHKDSRGMSASVVRRLDQNDGVILKLEHFDQGADSLLVYATDRGQIRSWDLRTQKEPWSVSNSPHLGLITAFLVDPNRNWLAVGTDAGNFTCWDLRFRVPLLQWGLPSFDGLSGIHALAADPMQNGCFWASVGPGLVTHWNLETKQCRRVLRVSPRETGVGKSAPIDWDSIMVPKDDAGDAGDDFRIADLQRPLTESARSLEAHLNTIRAVTVSPSGNFVLTGGADKRLRFWNFENPTKSFIMSGKDPKEEATYSTWESASKRISGMEETRSAVRDSPMTGSSTPQTPSGAHCDTILDVKLLELHSKKLLAVSASRDGVIKVWK